MWPKLIRCLSLLQDQDVGVEVSHDGQWVMSCHAGNVIQLWDARSGEVQFMLRTHINDRISWFEFCPTGGLLAIGTDEGKVMICMLYSCSCDTCTKLYLLSRELWPGATCLTMNFSLHISSYCLYHTHGRPDLYTVHNIGMHMINVYSESCSLAKISLRNITWPRI